MLEFKVDIEQLKKLETPHRSLGLLLYALLKVIFLLKIDRESLENLKLLDQILAKEGSAVFVSNHPGRKEVFAIPAVLLSKLQNLKTLLGPAAIKYYKSAPYVFLEALKKLGANHFAVVRDKDRRIYQEKYGDGDELQELEQLGQILFGELKVVTEQIFDNKSAVYALSPLSQRVDNEDAQSAHISTSFITIARLYDLPLVPVWAETKHFDLHHFINLIKSLPLSKKIKAGVETKIEKLGAFHLKIGKPITIEELEDRMNEEWGGAVIQKKRDQIRDDMVSNNQGVDDDNGETIDTDKIENQLLARFFMELAQGEIKLDEVDQVAA